MSVLLARLLSPAAYGAFALGFTIFLVIASIHSAIIVEPVSVLGPSRHAGDTTAFLRRAIGLHCLSMGLLGAICLAISVSVTLTPGGREVGTALAAMSFSFPVILLFWLMRRAHYLETRPGQAALASAIHLAALAAVVGGLWRFQKLGAATGFLALGAASLAASFFSMKRLGVGFRSLTWGREQLQSAWLEVWDFGRWLLPSALFYPLLAQVQLFLTATLLGLAAAGVLRALQNPIQPVVQVVTALATLAMPALARDFGAGKSVFRRALVFTGAMTAVALTYEVGVLLTGDLWDRLLYSGRYSADAWLMPILGLMPVASSLASGCSVYLRAIHRPELTTLTHVCGGVFGAVASYFLIVHFRLPGAVYALVASQTVTALVSVVLMLRARHGAKEPSPAR